MTRLFSRPGAFSLEVDHATNRILCCIPVSGSHVDYHERYRISADQYAAFCADPRAAKVFADQCRRRDHDDLLVDTPGPIRATPRLPDESPLVQSAIMLLDTFTSRPKGYALGFHTVTGVRYLSIPVPTGLVDQDEHFEITPDEFKRFSADEAAALAFADACRRRENNHRLVVKP